MYSGRPNCRVSAEFWQNRCGCLSMDSCGLFNPDDELAETLTGTNKLEVANDISERSSTTFVERWSGVDRVVGCGFG